jgi:hypothetical protein
MGWERSTNSEDEKFKKWLKTLKGSDYSEDLEVDGRVMLK